MSRLKVSTDDKPYIFISYSHNDSEQVLGICEQIQNHRYRFWYDEGILLGDEYFDMIANKIYGCKCFIAFLSSNYVSSSFCKKEIDLALQYDHVTVITVYLDQFAMPPAWLMRVMHLHSLMWYSYYNKEEAIVKLFETIGIGDCKIEDNIFKTRVLGEYEESDSYTFEDEAHIQEIGERGEPGDLIRFGTFQQNADGGPTQLKWLILKKDKDKVLVTTMNGITAMPFHTGRTFVTWPHCSARKWLNTEFYETAFSEEEKAYILDTDTRSDVNPRYRTCYEEKTIDKIFLFSVEEVLTYFEEDDYREINCTEYARVVKNAFVAKGNGKCWWWLRTPGMMLDYGTFVSIDGSLSFYGEDLVNDSFVLRPVMWLSLEAQKKK